MKILTDCSFLSEKQVEKIERKYDAKYVFESQLKLKDGKWSDFSAAVLYTEVPRQEGFPLSASTEAREASRRRIREASRKLSR